MNTDKITLLAVAALAAANLFAAEVYVAATDFTSFVDADGNSATLADGDDIIIAERDGLDVWNLNPGTTVSGHNLIVKNSCAIISDLSNPIVLRDYKTVYMKGGSIAKDVAIEGYGTFYFSNNVAIDGELIFNGGPVTLDFGGHTLTRSTSRTSRLSVNKDTQLVITGNGSIECASTESWDLDDVYLNNGSAKCTIENGTFNGNLHINWGACTIKAGSFNGELIAEHGNNFVFDYASDVDATSDWKCYYKTNDVEEVKTDLTAGGDLVLFDHAMTEDWGGESTLYFQNKVKVADSNWKMHFELKATDIVEDASWDDPYQCRFAVAFQNETKSGKKSTGNQWNSSGVLFIDTSAGFFFDSTKWNHYVTSFSDEQMISDELVNDDMFYAANFLTNSIAVDLVYDGTKVTVTFKSGNATLVRESTALATYLKNTFSDGAYITFAAFAKNMGLEIDDFSFDHDGRLSLANCPGWTFDFRSADFSPLMTLPAAAVLPESIAVTVLTESIKSFPTKWTTVADMSACSPRITSATIAGDTTGKLGVHITTEGLLQVRKNPGLILIFR